MWLWDRVVLGYNTCILITRYIQNYLLILSKRKTSSMDIYAPLYPYSNGERNWIIHLTKRYIFQHLIWRLWWSCYHFFHSHTIGGKKEPILVFCRLSLQTSEFEFQPQLKQFRDAWRACEAKFNSLCLFLLILKKRKIFSGLSSTLHIEF